MITETKSDYEEKKNIIRSIKENDDCSDNAQNIGIDAENFKLFLGEGFIGNYNNLAVEICKAVAEANPECEFYGHSFYDDENCGYESCADYKYSEHKLHIETIVSENGHGFCPDYGEQIVCFDEFDPDNKYYCDDCEIEISHEDLFDGCIPEKMEYSFEF